MCGNPRHASVGTSSLNRIASGSRLLLPVTAGILDPSSTVGGNVL